MENFSAAITFMRANPPTTGHFLIVDTLHNLPVDKKYIYLSHSQDKKKNPLPYFEKYSFIKTFVEEKYNDIEVVNSEARTLIDALYEINSKGCNDITIVLGSDRIEEFSTLVYKYNGQISKKTGEIIYQFDNINFVQAGEDRDENSSDELSAISATKQRTLAAEGNFEEFSKGVPTADPYLKKELYDLLREYMGLEALKEDVFDKISNKVSQFIHGDPVEKYYEVGPIIKGWWRKDSNGLLGFLSKDPWKYEVEWWPESPDYYKNIHIYHLIDLEDKVHSNVKAIDVVDAEFKKIGKYDKVLYATVKVVYKNERAYQKYNKEVMDYLKTYTNPDNSYNDPSIFRYLPTWEELEKEDFPETKVIEIEK